MTSGRVAVAIQGIAPTNLELCHSAREWLLDRGVDRATLFVIPAPRHQPFPGKRPELADWLDRRLALGDAIAQLGFTRTPGDGLPSEFARATAEECIEVLETGRRLLERRGFAPRGFAPADYAWTPALRQAARRCFDWSAERMRVPGGLDGTARALSPGRPARFGWLTGRVGGLASREILRLDLWPGDVADVRSRESIERLLDAAGPGRHAITYDEMGSASEAPALTYMPGLTTTTTVAD